MKKIYVFLMALLLTACGQSGQLVLPEKPTAQKSVEQKPAEPVPEAQPQDKKEEPQTKSPAY